MYLLGRLSLTGRTKTAKIKKMLILLLQHIAINGIVTKWDPHNVRN